MQVSNSGIDFIKREEGEKLTGYPDSRGIPTVGVGHTGNVNGKPVTVGMKISADQSSELLKGDLAWVEDTIRNYVKSPLVQNQYDALCSFIFNIGKNAFKGSTMLKLLNKANYQGAADEFPKWKKSGNDPDILLPRRQRERALFLS
ncbi:lysozyme [Citrobacter portucalensis]|uniref:lysozyme n=1 Tax=Citrobacter portucalensis TaxID=1639133 RepID=UPI002431845D|nr:lysozyme [Citrobacter portucalensis]WFZ22227.1 lysozyme [Citrobacter portucalensis]